jgi:hypothetical protein
LNIRQDLLLAQLQIRLKKLLGMILRHLITLNRTSLNRQLRYDRLHES